MATIYALYLKFMPFMIAFAGNESFVDKLVKWAAGFGGGIVAVFLIVSLVKDGIEFAKGQGSVSIWKILGKAIFLILIIGLVFLAQNYKTLGNTAKGIGDKAVNTVNTEMNNILP